jgi:hypothetical protein
MSASGQPNRRRGPRAKSAANRLGAQGQAQTQTGGRSPQPNQFEPSRDVQGPVSPRVSTAILVAAAVMGPIVALAVGRWFEESGADGANLPLLGILWLLVAAIVFLGWGVLQRFRGEEGEESPAVLPARMTVLILISAVALGIIVNQLQ